MEGLHVLKGEGDQTNLYDRHDHDHDQKQQQEEAAVRSSSSGGPRRRRRRRVVLFPCPYQGHLNPMLQLASLLHTKGGFSITVVHTRFNSPNPSNYPHFHFVPISDGIIHIDSSSSSSSSSSSADHHQQYSSTTSTSSDNIIPFLAALNLNCVDPFRDCLLRLLSSSSSSSRSTAAADDDEIIACIIADATMHFTQAVAESLQLPRIVLRTSSVTSFVAFAAYPLLLQKGYLPIRDSELEKPVTELPPLKVKDLPVVKTKNPEDLYEFVAEMTEKTRSSSGLIWNSFEGLEQPALDTIRRDFHQIPSFPIGPFHKWSTSPAHASNSSSSSSSLLPEDHSCITWLDRQPPRSVIYVSFGSLADMDETDLVETAWGLLNSGHPFLWVLRPGFVRRSTTGSLLLHPDGDDHEFNINNLLQEMISSSGISSRGATATATGGSSSNYCIVKWAPQQQVLAHLAVGGFWTHSGWNSTLEGVSEGVPMLCRPCFGDQMVNARLVSEVWKVGFQFDNCRPLERGEVERAITKLMSVLQPRPDDINMDDDQMTMRVRIRELKEKADLCLKEAGSSSSGSSFQSIESLIHLISSY